jgi:TDG/mug DNA glycosylase family protein
VAARRRPTKAERLAAVGRTVEDVIAPGLRVLFCGINPGLYTAVTGHHFAGPGNRFWPALYASGFTPRLLRPDEERELLDWGLGITNVVPRATAAAAELGPEDYESGGRLLTEKLMRYRPAFLAVLGIGAYRTAFGQPGAAIGPQPEAIGETRLWVLPNPSGLNANYQAPQFAALFGELRAAVEGSHE